MQSRQDDRLGYRPALDGVRAVAIALVVLHHTAALLVPSRQNSFFPGGFLGVDLFLVLSGFLITTLLLDRRGRERRPIATFYLRRALRLIPALVALLLANLLYALVHGGVGAALRSIAVVIAYATNWAELAGVSISSYVTHLWTLAVEEQFYLVWPLLLFSALRLWPSRRRLAWLALSVALLAAAWRLALYQSGVPWLRIYIRTDTRADALAIGAALALAPWQRLAGSVDARTRSIAGGLALGVLIAAAELVQPYDAILYRGGFTIVALAAAVLIFCVLEPCRLSQVLSWRPLVVIGLLSYAVYLWHFGVFQVVAAHTASWAAGPRVALAWALTLLAAAASYRLVEQPALAFKSRLGRRAPGAESLRLEADQATRPVGAAAATAGGEHRAETGPAAPAS